MKKYFLYFYFFASCVILFFLCHPAREGSFLVCFYAIPYYIDHFKSWTEIFKCRFDISYHLFFHLFIYSVYKLFHTHANRWLLLNVILQAGVLTSSFVLFKKILTKATISHAFGIALTGSLLLLFSPYICEIVVWGPTSNYLISVLTVIICWLLLIRYFETDKSKYLWLSHLCYLASIYTFELGVVFPFMIAIYMLFWTKKSQFSLRQAILILLPQFLIIFSFFLMNRIVLGNWVGHYGAGEHLNFPPAYMSSQFACYLLKYIGLIHFFQYPTRDSIYSFVQQPAIGYILFLLLYIIPLLLFLLRYKKMSDAWRIGFLLYAFMCLALLPAQNMYFMYLFQSQNDRLGYFYSVFFYAFLAYIMIRTFKWFGYIILLIYGIIGFHFMKMEIGNWQKAGHVVQTLIKEYQWANNPGKVHILMLGYNINGVYEFETSGDSACFAGYYEVITQKNCSPLQQYMYMTMASEDDAVTANVVNDSTIQVDLLSGNWLLYNGLGAVNYKTTDASIVVNKQKPSYQIIFRNKKPGDVYIYQSGSHWKQVNGF